jgi:hypothetical protein
MFHSLNKKTPQLVVFQLVEVFVYVVPLGLRGYLRWGLQFSGHRDCHGL